MAFHPALQYNGSTYFIHQSLVLSGFFAYSAHQHRLMRQDTGVPLVPHVNGYGGEGFSQFGNKCPHPGQVVAVTSVCLLGQPYHETFHAFLLDVLLQVIHQLSCVHRAESACYYLQGVRHSQTCPTNPIVYRKYSSHAFSL